MFHTPRNPHPSKYDNVNIYSLPTPIMCKLLNSSVNSAGEKIYTFEWYIPKFILAEVNKHRALSGSTSSDRAIPTAKLIAEYAKNGWFKPLYFGKNKGGMSSHEELPTLNRVMSNFWWNCARVAAVFFAKRLGANNLHKQWTNRLLLPFIYCHHVTTGTDWDNFLYLRDDADAVQPEFAILARKVKHAIESAQPRLLTENPELTSSWHFAYITASERALYADNPQFLARIDAARCARASYAKQGERFNSHYKDMETFDKLTGSKLHATPLEHACHSYPNKQDKNFRGFKQFRTLVESSRTDVYK